MFIKNKSMREIKTLHELVELGIQLKKQDLPNGFIVTVWAKKENRTKIYSQLLDEGITTEYWKVETKDFGAHNFKVLGINFLLF